MDAPKTRRENEVWQACDDLWALNTNLESLKGDAIRDQLIKLGYKKGSPNEIYKYRSTWKESRGISDKSLAETVEVADPISRAVSLVYQQIQNEAQQKITVLQNESDTQIESLTRQNQDLILSCETLLQKHQALEEEKKGLEISVELLREHLTEQQQENTRGKLRLEGLELLLSELKGTYVAQIDKLESRLKTQGYTFSEELNQVKLQARQERENTQKQALASSAKAQQQLGTSLKKEFQKLTVLVKKLRRKPKPKQKSKPKTVLLTTSKP